MSSLFKNLFSFLRKPAAGAPAGDGAKLRTLTDRLGDVRTERKRLEQGQVEGARERDPAYRFLELGEVYRDFRSSNVVAFWYERDKQDLFVQYKDGSTYVYHTITPATAATCLTADSKGGWVWSTLRQRGTKLGHKVPYALVFSGAKPRAWEATPAAAKKHADEVDRQSAAGTYARLAKFTRKP